MYPHKLNLKTVSRDPFVSQSPDDHLCQHNIKMFSNTHMEKQLNLKGKNMDGDVAACTVLTG